MRVQKAPGHVYSRQNNTETPDPLHTLPISPDLCVILTFKDSDDPLKAVAHKNTADMYRSFQPRVRAFLTNPVPQEASRTWGMQVLDAAETNQHGTPVFMSLMKLIEDACPLAPLLAYANADILFDNRLLDNLDALLAWNQSDVLAVGSRSNHDLQGPLTTDDISIVNSELFIDLAQDYFIMSRDTVKKLKDLPAYVIGRRGYDNALVDWAYHSLNLVDLTQTLTALHQTTSDGNYAGHSPSNIDKEYNVQLPNAQYDHGSTSHAQYYSLPHNGRVAVMRKSDNTMVIPEKGRKQQTSHRKLQLYLHGKQVEYEDLPSPLLVTFGNAAYREILANFLCNTLTFAPMHAHTLVIVTDQQTVDYLAALDTDVFIGLYPSEMQQARDYDTPGYTLLMLLRGQLLLEFLGSRVIVWMEADAEYFGNILDNQQIASASTDLVLYWDGTMYGGGFIRFAATEAAKSFYAAIVSRMQAGIERRDFTDDQIILQDIIKTTSATHSEFDRCQFRSGRYYRAEYAQEYQKLCKDKRPMVQQHNWVVGNAKKIEMAKRHDAWFLIKESPEPVCNPGNVRKHMNTTSAHNHEWKVYMSPATLEVIRTSCISVSVLNSCATIAEGPATESLDSDEMEVMSLQRDEVFIDGPAFVHANGEINDCTTRDLFRSCGCGDCSPAQQQDCPAIAVITVERALVITQFWGEGYFHLVVEGLTRLAEAMQSHQSFFRGHQVYIHTSNAGSARNFLTILGMNYVASGTMLVTKQLLSPRPTPCGGHIKSRHAIWLRGFLPLTKRPPNTTVLIQRAGSREILNHHDLFHALPGDVKVHTGQETILHQLQMFTDAKIVIGPHGSGMANIMAMSENNSVVELQVAPANHCYMFLAFNLGLRYHAHYEPGAVHDGKWSVDIAKVLQIPVFMQ